MKRPWQIWLLFFLCLTFVVAALGWLSAKVVELDRLEIEAQEETLAAERMAAEAFREAELARRNTELQERISNALWRMDWTLTPLVAQEAARPYFVYQPFFSAGNNGMVKGAPQQPQNLMPSPLLVTPSEFVHVHFQLDPNEDWASPQNPVGRQASAANSFGATPKTIHQSLTRLNELKSSLKHQDLLRRLPEQLIPPMNLANNAEFNYNLNNDEYIANTTGAQVFNAPGVKSFDQQLEAQRNSNSQQSLPPQQSRSPRTRSGRRGAAQAQWRRDYAQQRVDLSMRNGLVWQSRLRGINAYAQSSALQQRAGNQMLPLQPVQLAKEGVSRPLWIGDKLLLARRTLIGNQTVIQGCWLNWKKLKAALLGGIAELLPEDADLVAVRDPDNSSYGRMLATLPVVLKVTEPKLADIPLDESLEQTPKRTRWSAIRASLGIAWLFLCVGTVAVAILLKGVVKLSERRGAFVSAVTHELRTPLTTFRMYAEMLSEGMVPAAEQRQKYLDTLRVEADRLSHLVENVLQYAQLERHQRGKKRESLAVGKLIEQMRQRIVDRAEQAHLQLDLDLAQPVAATNINTDPAAVEQILFNLVDNACKYAVASDQPTIDWQVKTGGTMLQISVSDRGPGISEKAARQLFKPFSKSVHDAADSAPGVGLGLALSRQLAQALGGALQYESRDGGGACFTLLLPLSTA